MPTAGAESQELFSHTSQSLLNLSSLTAQKPQGKNVMLTFTRDSSCFVSASALRARTFAGCFTNISPTPVDEETPTEQNDDN